MTTTGANLIAAERERQVREEHWTAEHDDEHDGGELVEAALIYASPRVLYVKSDSLVSESVSFLTVWPGRDWECKVDAGRTNGRGLDRSAVKEINESKPARRIRELTKAGALIAAEIDRLQRQEARRGGR